MPITEDFVKHLMEQNAAMAGQISQLTKTVESLNQTIQKLQEQLNKNSKNSSKPPSSDGFKKPPVNKDRSLRQSSGKKQGGQEGHEGKYLGSVFSIPLATGTIKNMVSRFAGSLSGTYERIRQHMTVLELIHCDETGTRADGKTCWVHNASNAD